MTIESIEEVRCGSIEDVQGLGQAVNSEVAKTIIGQEDLTQMAMIAVLAGGHILLEGPPGTAKTLFAQCFAHSVGLDYGRIQFTPDLMPGDILGSNLFNFQTSSFTLTRGPIFTEVLLADEINRTPPKTQAALLEAMQERRVTINGEEHVLNPYFTVLATQNPIEQQGVYPLPEAQLDRFLFKLLVDYPSAEQERRIVSRHGTRFTSPSVKDFGTEKVADAAVIGRAIEVISRVAIIDEVIDYIVRLVRATRETAELEYGASPRSASMLARASCASAALEGRNYAIPDDVKRLAVPVLRHRVILSPTAEIEERTVEDIVTGLVEQTKVPR